MNETVARSIQEQVMTPKMMQMRERICESELGFKLFWFNIGLLRFKYRVAKAIALAEAVAIVCLLIALWR